MKQIKLNQMERIEGSGCGSSAAGMYLSLGSYMVAAVVAPPAVLAL